MFYPFQFKEIVKEKIWGGTKLREEFDKKVKSSVRAGESWELSAVPKNESIVANGKDAGENLHDLIIEYKELILGEKVFEKTKHEFPLLIKFIDAADKLSVQVHPDDTYARKHHNSFGKTEIWFVLSAQPDAKLIAGLKEGVTKEDVARAIKENTLSDILNYIPVAQGDVIYIPAGRVHALLEGIVIAEIQQTSDITYRLYDWERKDSLGNRRALHIEDSLAVISYDDRENPKIEKTFVSETGFRKADVFRGDYFSIEEVHLCEGGTYKNVTRKEESFHILIGLEGRARIIYDRGEENFKKGTTFLIPAALGEYSVQGTGKFLRVYI